MPVAETIDLQAISTFARDYGVRKLSLFGSAARGELTPASDIDVLVEFRPDAHPTFFTLVQMSEELEPLFGGEHAIDLVTQPGIHPLIWRHVKRDLVTLYEQG